MGGGGDIKGLKLKFIGECNSSGEQCGSWVSCYLITVQCIWNIEMLRWDYIYFSFRDVQ